MYIFLIYIYNIHVHVFRKMYFYIHTFVLYINTYIHTYILHALSLAGLGVHESSLREPMDATFWLKEMSQNSIHFVFNLVVLYRFWLIKG